MDRRPRIEFSRDALAALCGQHHIKRLAFFERPLDMVSFKHINHRLRARILADAQMQHEAV